MFENTYLQKILTHKEKEIAERKLRRPQKTLEKEAVGMASPRGFRDALDKHVCLRKPAVIAEIKKASPSKGVIASDFDVASIAKDYAANGAVCLSVLTDEKFFQGKDEYLQIARSQVDIPVLRKDFIIDEYQIWESRVLGADCILLIVAAITDEHLTLYYRLAHQMGLDVLIEVHDESELELALQFKGAVIGVNNRNLKTFETDLTISHRLRKKVPLDRWIVTESGIETQEDVLKMEENDIYAFLVGSSFMSADSPGIALKQIFFS